MTANSNIDFKNITLKNHSKENSPEYILMNPGPVITSHEVNNALSNSRICHRDYDFEFLIAKLENNMKTLFKAIDDHSVLFITGSGTAGLESAISSAITERDKLLIISNGFFGERLKEIADVHKINTHHVRYKWGQKINTTDIENILNKDQQITAIAMVHHETSVCSLNPVKMIGDLCNRYSKFFIVDAISSLGAEDINVIRDNIDICISTSGKCLHSVPGISPVCISKRGKEKILVNTPRSYYLDLRKYFHYHNFKQMPFTPGVHLLAALDQAVNELLETGITARYSRYTSYLQIIKDSLCNKGFNFYNSETETSSSVLLIRKPDFVSLDYLLNKMKEKGFIIYKCKGELEFSYFQVSVMGELSEPDIQNFIKALKEIAGEK